jgi:hypothetical protein
MNPNEANDRAMQLISHGKELLAKFPRDRDGDRAYWTTGDMTVKCRSFLAQVRNFVDLTCRPGDTFHATLKELVSHKDFVDGNAFPSHTLEGVQGLLEALSGELASGRLKSVVYQVTAASFVAFLDHAVDLSKRGDHQGSGVLVSVVFEDTVRKLAEKNKLGTTESIDSTLDQLVSLNVLTAVKRSRAKAVAALRNKALHAKWNEFDISDVKTSFDSVRELIELLEG